MSVQYPIDLTPVWQVYRGDETSYGITDADDAGTPTDLTALGGAWTCQVRATADSATAVDVAVDDTNAATGVLILNLTGDQTAAMQGTVYGFDVQVTGGPIDPLTVYSGRLALTKDYTR